MSAGAGARGWEGVPGCGRLSKALPGTASWRLRNYSSARQGPALLPSCVPSQGHVSVPSCLVASGRRVALSLCVASRVGAGAPSPAPRFWVPNRAPEALEDAQAEGVVGEQSHAGRVLVFPLYVGSGREKPEAT